MISSRYSFTFALLSSYQTQTRYQSSLLNLMVHHRLFALKDVLHLKVKQTLLTHNSVFRKQCFFSCS